MRSVVIVLSLSLMCLPVQARPRKLPGGSSATVSGGFSPTMPFGPSASIAPATTGFSPTCPYGPSYIPPASTGFSTTAPVPNINLNSSYGVRRGYGYGYRHGYYNGFYNSGYTRSGSFNGGGIPGYDQSLPQRTVPGY